MEEKTEQVVTPQSVVKKVVMPNTGGKNVKMIAVSVVVILAGVASGWLLSGKKGIFAQRGAAPGAEVSQNEAGIADESTFTDSAEGVLEQGGIEGEGTHHLVRDGGLSKYVYLTSTVIDLESFVGKKVTVWGQTSSGRTAGWLMDVGKIKTSE